MDVVTRSTRRLIAVLALAVLVGGGGHQAAAASGPTTRVSVDSAGRQANGGSYGPALSADGRVVAFESYASTLVAGDTNGRADIFVHERPQPAVCLVQLAASGQVLGTLVNQPSAFTLALLVPSAPRTTVPVSCQALEALALAVANQHAGAVEVSVEVFTHQGTSLCTRGPFTLPADGARGVVFGSDCVPPAAPPSPGE